eukprot:Opistho-2@23086
MSGIITETSTVMRPSSAVDIPNLSLTSQGDGAESAASSVGSVDYSTLKKRRPKGTGVDAFDAKYRLSGEIIGRGTSSIVQTCRERATNAEFVVKTVDIDPNKAHWVMEQCQREHDILRMCKEHPNIVQLIDYFATPTKVHFVLERLYGGALFDRVISRGSLTEYEASLVIADIANALLFCHSNGIAHRDLKPQNVLCASLADIVPVKITDFNLGNSSTTVTTPPLKTPVGTPEYWAPEIIDVMYDPSHTYDKRCDIWSLGCLLYMLLCGHPPFVGGCGPNCGWNAGNGCEYCEDSLQERIQLGEFDFDGPEWYGISDNAKDLICGMLCTDVASRLTCESVRAHKWFQTAGISPATPLMSPAVFSRGSMVAYARFARELNAMNRGDGDDSLQNSFNSSSIAGGANPFFPEGKSLEHSSSSLTEFGAPPSFRGAETSKPPAQLSNGGSLGLVAALSAFGLSASNAQNTIANGGDNNSVAHVPPETWPAKVVSSATAPSSSASTQQQPATPVAPLSRPLSSISAADARGSGGSSRRSSDISDDGSDRTRLSLDGLSLSKSSILSRRANGTRGRRRSSGGNSTASFALSSQQSSYADGNAFPTGGRQDDGGGGGGDKAGGAAVRLGALASNSMLSTDSEISPTETDSLGSFPESPAAHSSDHVVRALQDGSATSVGSKGRARLSEDETQFVLDE